MDLFRRENDPKQSHQIQMTHFGVRYITDGKDTKMLCANERIAAADTNLKGWVKLLISVPTPPTSYFFMSKDGKTWQNEQYCADWPASDLWYGYIVTSKNTQPLYKSSSYIEKIVGSERMLPTAGLFWSVSPAPCGWNLHLSRLVWMAGRRTYDLIMLKLMDIS